MNDNLVSNFRSDLAALESEQIFRKYILNNNSPTLTQHSDYQLKEEISNFFKIEFRDVVLVGSAQLGFSIKPKQLFRLFNDDSDIDIAIISERLFVQVWKEVYAYKKSGAYWPKCEEFVKYLSEGWIRPDKLPPSDNFTFAQEWWDFFQDITNSNKYGPYKIRAGLYYSHFFLEQYQLICIDQCKQGL